MSGCCIALGLMVIYLFGYASVAVKCEPDNGKGAEAFANASHPVKRDIDIDDRNSIKSVLRLKRDQSDDEGLTEDGDYGAYGSEDNSLSNGISNIGSIGDISEYDESCDDTMFMCKNGNPQCVPINDRCNGTISCEDGSDEKDCIRATLDPNFYPENNFPAMNSNDNHEQTTEFGPELENSTDNDDSTALAFGDEYESTTICNLGQACEKFTTDKTSNSCADQEYKCDNGICIPFEDGKTIHCDGIYQCQDNSDENDCPKTTNLIDATPTIKCHHQEFSCSDGTCISSKLRCDGTYNCADQSDEEYCNENCSEGQFVCHDGNQCVSADLKCDGTDDCIDKSDELDCNFHPDKCPRNMFKCHNGLCIDSQFQCDGNFDCKDESDEQQCDICKEGAFKCGDNKCILNSKRCDRKADCFDFSDEEDCHYACGADQVQCTDGLCIDSNLICDGIQNCHNGDDERGCDHHIPEKLNQNQNQANLYHELSTPSQCNAEQFRCDDNQCINEEFYCDGTKDCLDDSDEKPGCSKKTRVSKCLPNALLCADGSSCYLQSKQCDGFPDCQDYSDEDGCEHKRNACRSGQFTCRNGQCVSSSDKCNGYSECSDHSDEDNCPTNNAHHLNLRTYPDNQTIQEHYIREGDEVVFLCRDEGPNRVKVRWTRPSGFSLPTGSSDYNGRLEIPNIRIEHKGDYACEAIGYSHLRLGRTIVTLNVNKRPLRPTPLNLKACQGHEATCMNGNCIKKSQICDGRNDCGDNSDESTCSRNNRCEPNEYQCADRKCILKTWRCDGEYDCEDQTDELDCHTTSDSFETCRNSEFQCASGQQCIPKSFQCDLHTDCHDGSDEHGCAKPTVAVLPPPFVELHSGDTFNISCRAVGVPIPLVTWRLNWGHVPTKCSTTSIHGLGVLSCPHIEMRDSGAYSCELINSMGTVLVSPDTILKVSENQSVCPRGTFNRDARRPEQCINCFCFGVTNQCGSANLFTFSLPPPVSSLTILGVRGPFNGAGELITSTYNQNDLSVSPHGSRLRIFNVQVFSDYPYYAMPYDYLGSQLLSYGGFFRYEVQFTAGGDSINAPDIIITGNGYTLTHSASNHFESGTQTIIAAEFVPGFWRHLNDRLATREELMMVLASVDQLLIRLVYTDKTQREVELFNIVMDSAETMDRGLGSASLVEECRCPIGYIGLSCENCSPGYVRQRSGPWLGRCVLDAEPCRPGTYGDPFNGVPCRECPCPQTGAQNFARSCSLNGANEVRCDCRQGYIGTRCETCAPGYEGVPLAPGGQCRPIREPSHCDPHGTDRETSSGQCICKQYTTGALCNRCQADAFDLNSYSEGGCTQCFCMGVSHKCSSSKLFRNTIHANPTGESEFNLISDLDNPESVTVDLQSNRSELLARFAVGDTRTFWWKLPANIFGGSLLTAYGGHLNYTVRFTTPPGGLVSSNNAPDVVIRSRNDYTMMHYRIESTNGQPSTYSVRFVESEWQRPKGEEVTREHLLMALDDVTDVFVKATYRTNTETAAILAVSMETASTSPNGERLAHEVEHCVCPEGHEGLSCERCSAGYGRDPEGGDGLYLGWCRPCQCNGHSNSCDEETGVCHECRHNTVGNQCEQCSEGYEGNATLGNPNDCQPININVVPTDCICDERGTESCTLNGACVCKANVIGENCDQCREGTFNLNATDNRGCQECFCSGVTRTCSSARLHRIQLPLNAFDDQVSITNRRGAVVHDSRVIQLDLGNNRFYKRIDGEKGLFWSLPARFLGNQVPSYGGSLTYTVGNIGDGLDRHYEADQDVLIHGNGLTLFWTRPHAAPQFARDELTSSVRLIEREWQSVDRQNGVRSVSRADLITVLSDLEFILLRGTLWSSSIETYLADVSLDTAVAKGVGSLSSEVEHCHCPAGYRGYSCERCDHLFYHDRNDRGSGLLGACKPCPCSANAESCHSNSEHQIVCECKAGYYGERCTDDEPVDINDPLRPEPTPPTIQVTITSPLMEIVEFGQTVRLTCSGYSLVNRIPITVSWHRENGKLPEDRSYQSRGTGTLVLNNVQYDDSGIYVCNAHNGSEVAEKRVTLTIGNDNNLKPIYTKPTSPIITLNPPYIEQSVGSRADIQCQASGTAPIDITWERLQGTIGSHVQIHKDWLRFNDLRQSDNGEYRCTARNNYGYDDKFLRVNILDLVPPQRIVSVSISPPSINALVGDELQLHCQSDSLEPAHVIWTRPDGLALPTNAYLRRDTLVIHRAEVRDSGEYICTISIDGHGKGHASARLFVSPDNIIENRHPPQLEPFQPQYTITQGDDLRVPCRLVEGLNADNVEWIKLHDEFSNNVHKTYSRTSSELIITNAVVENRGTYLCRASNTEGEDELSTVIEVDRLEPPVVQIQPSESQTIRVGDTIYIQCHFTAGIPDPIISWSRPNGQPLSDRISDDGQGTLRLNDVTADDSGAYICTATNAAGRQASTTTVVVEQDPRIVQPADDNEVLRLTVGDELRLDCVATGIPVPLVSWLRDDQRLSNKKIDMKLSESDSHALLLRQSVRMVDAGIYRCLANNTAGQDERIVTVNVEPKRGDVGSYGEESDLPNVYPQEIEFNPQSRPSEPLITSIGSRTVLDCNYSNRRVQGTWVRADGRPLSVNSYQEQNRLIIEITGADDAGLYQCIDRSPTTGRSLIVVEAEIIITELPSISFDPPMPMTVRSGENVTIHCNVSGSPPIRVHWYAADNQPFPRSILSRGALLHFTHIAPSDAGQYICTASNTYGHVSRTAQVNVGSAEVIDDRRPGDEQHNAIEGGSVQLRCSHDQAPIGTRYNWSRENVNLPVTAKFTSHNNLMILNVRKEDEGRYVCQMTLPNGEVVNTHVDVVVVKREYWRRTRRIRPINGRK